MAARCCELEFGTYFPAGKAPEPAGQMLLLLPSEVPTTKTGADGAGPSECTAGVTPAPSENPG